MGLEVLDEVFLSHDEDIKRYGKGPFSVLKVNKAIGTVTLNKIGTVSMEDIQYPNEKKENVTVVKTPKKLTEKGKGRIENICGGLLSHPDDNVKSSMREVLRIIWDYED